LRPPLAHTAARDELQILLGRPPHQRDVADGAGAADGGARLLQTADQARVVAK
jgi:hypothetical protein